MNIQYLLIQHLINIYYLFDAVVAGHVFILHVIKLRVIGYALTCITKRNRDSTFI